MINAELFDYTDAALPKLTDIIPTSIDIDEIKHNHSYKIDLLENDKFHATSPCLLVTYLFFKNKDEIKTIEKTFSSIVFYVIKGAGEVASLTDNFSWKKGDVFTFPCRENIKLQSYKDDTILLQVDDGPLLHFLYAKPIVPRFSPTYYDADILRNFVLKNLQDPESKTKNRNGVLLSNKEMVSENLNTLSHTMWSLLNVTKANSYQKPHRHNSVALDLCIEAIDNKVYTLMGKELNEDGSIKDPTKIYWKTNCLFVTPPGWWHSHHNESNIDAWVFPVQDAGLHTYLRTLDIQFVN